MTTHNALYAGSFDPVTHGHLDLIERGSRLFDRLVVAVASNIEKSPVFSEEERIELIREAIGDRFPNVEVCAFNGLIVEFARRRGIRYLMRGLRNGSDFESETQMAYTNSHLAPEIETVFLTSSLEHSYISSRLIREAVKLGADMSQLIPPLVQRRLHERLTRKDVR